MKGRSMSVAYFGPRLRELREQAGLTQEQLAERAGVKRDAVARWERNNREPSWGNILAEREGVSAIAPHSSYISDFVAHQRFVRQQALTGASELPSTQPDRPRQTPREET